MTQTHWLLSFVHMQLIYDDATNAEIGCNF